MDRIKGFTITEVVISMAIIACIVLLFNLISSNFYHTNNYKDLQVIQQVVDHIKYEEKMHHDTLQIPPNYSYQFMCYDAYSGDSCELSIMRDTKVIFTEIILR